MDMKVLPSVVEAEESLLGTMMVYPTAARTAIEAGLVEEDFYSDVNRRIFHEMNEMYRTGIDIDITSVISRLRDTNNLDKVGGIEYLTSLSKAAVTSANTRGYVTLIQDKAIMRRMIEACEEVVEDGYEGQPDANAYLDEAEDKILKISRNRRTSEFETSSEVFRKVADKIQIMAESKSSLTGLASGFRDFDYRTHGLQRGDLIILAARPSMGKTALALNFALQVAQHNRNGGAVAIFSLEMPTESLGLRLLSAKSRINANKLKVGKLTQDEKNRMNEALVDLQKLKFYMDDKSNITVNEIFSKCRRLKNEQGLDLIVIDYIQLIASGGKGRNSSREQEVSEISRSLKSLARELDVPVIALSQLSRNVESRDDKRPRLSDLRESGAIEQDADIVLMLYRESYYDAKAKELAAQNNSEAIEVNIAKHRNGDTGPFNLAFEPSTNAFLNIAREREEERNS